ncbi:MAG TPA: 50S ribosomal protein L35 [Spirochaetota bacterium]|nr:50S ribosomal protein L35 [Spirochaetota bacterium]HOL56054.1 50S ribosomal protein L35 [Spirochaetota bacterium]HPP03200.1 50S ribosomal protein L35 [Spirochaetota bacterium]
MSKVKVKSNKSAAQRFKITKNGKVLYNKRGRRHILTKKSAKRKRQLRKHGILKSSESKRVKMLLPYQ